MSVHCCGCMKARKQFCGSSLASFIVYMCSGDLTQVTRHLYQLSHLLASPKISPAYIITILFEAMAVHPMDKGVMRGQQSQPPVTHCLSLCASHKTVPTLPLPFMRKVAMGRIGRERNMYR